MTPRFLHARHKDIIHFKDNMDRFYLLLSSLPDFPLRKKRFFMDKVGSLDRHWGRWGERSNGIHREDGPAMSFYSHNNDVLFDAYRVRSAWHRNNGPAISIYEKFFEAPK